jgi:chitinase
VHQAYDLNGVWSNTAASNAPLRFGATGQQVSGESAVQAWINAGIPSDRIYLGVPFYGYTHKTLKPITRETGMDVPFDRTIPQIKGDNHDSYAADPCPGAKPSFSGEYQWRSIETSGVSRNASGWSTYWDQMTETPFAYNKQTNQFVTYDDPASLRIKTQFAKEHGLGGMMLWSLEMDDTSHSLLNALQGVRA